ncbi:MAG: PHP domain-containing protein [Ruminococcaceae bacterium]|nr:PHP domain-containing protein [Oscillospiraceae bacterium]
MVCLLCRSTKKERMSMFANCHFHSTFSDAGITPAELVATAKKIGHRALVLTDHDTVRGTYFLGREARRAGMLTLVGCEFTAGIHIVGIDFDPLESNMRRLLDYLPSYQYNRSKRLFEAGLEAGTLRQGICWQDVVDAYPDNNYLCNNQIFDVLVKKGIYAPEEYADFFKNSFSYNLDISKKIIAHMNFKYPDAEETIYAINKAGGVAIIAHCTDAQAKNADEYVKLGAKGFETRHPDMTEFAKDYLDAYCNEHRLYRSGGTDHSSWMSGLLGKKPEAELDPECGGVTEEDFMKLYQRELG